MKISVLLFFKKLLRSLKREKKINQMPFAWSVNIVEYRRNHPEISLSDREILNILENEESS